MKFDQWIVLICSFAIFFLFSGMQRTSGVLFVYVISELNVSRKEAMLLFVSNYATRHAFGPLVGYLGNRFGFRIVIFSGVLISSTSIAVCFFTRHVVVLTAFWGVFSGAGIGMCTSLIPITVKNHFKRSFSQANGVCYSGNSIGSIILPHVAKIAVFEYGLSGAFLILSGISLHGLPAALLLTRHKILQSSSNESEYLQKHCSSSLKKIRTIKSNADIVEGKNNAIVMEGSKQNDVLRTNWNSTDMQMHDLQEKENTKKHIIIKKDYEKDTGYLPTSNSVEGTTQTTFSYNISANNTEQLQKFRSKTEKISTESENKQISRRNSGKFNAFRIFLDPVFLDIMVCQSAFVVIVTVIWTVVVDVSRDLKIDRSLEVYLITLDAIGYNIGLLTLGWVTDRHYMSSSNFVATLYGFLGVSASMITLCNAFLPLAFVATSFGFATGGIVSTQPAVVVDRIEERDRPMALSSRFFLYAPLCFFVPDMTGYFRETLESYNGLLYTLSAVCMILAFLTFSIPFIVRCKCRNHHF